MHERKKILVFGAGRIGRSFIGQLFGRAGYQIVFAEADPDLVEQLNERGSYDVHILESMHPAWEQNFTIENVSAIHISDRKALVEELTVTSLAATSVGKAGLQSLIPVLLEGIKERYQRHPERSLDIIIAENIRNANELIRLWFAESSPGSFPVEYIGLIETSIGKMVPIITSQQLDSDPLAVYAESYNLLILDKLAFRNPIPDVKGLSPRENIKAWVDRKLFIHNMGHAALAYQAYFHKPDLRYTWEALEIQEIRDKVRDTMLQSAAILRYLYPGEFTKLDLDVHVDDLLLRFANRSLGDTIYRVGQDLPRKLAGDDRLIVPICAALEKDLPFRLILEAWMKGCSFAALDEKGSELEADQKFRLKYGLDYKLILRKHCGLKPGLIKRILEYEDYG